MSDVEKILKRIHQTSDEEKFKAYERADDILKMLKTNIDTSELIHSDDLIHFCLFRTCLVETKINHLLELILEVTKK